MFELILLVILSAIACEATVEIITKSELFAPLLEGMALREDFFSRLLSCPYCLSVWVAGFYTGLILFFTGWELVWVSPILVFSIHRLSNSLHLGWDILNARKNRGSAY